MNNMIPVILYAAGKIRPPSSIIEDTQLVKNKASKMLLLHAIVEIGRQACVALRELVAFYFGLLSSLFYDAQKVTNSRHTG